MALDGDRPMIELEWTAGEGMSEAIGRLRLAVVPEGTPVRVLSLIGVSWQHVGELTYQVIHRRHGWGRGDGRWPAEAKASPHPFAEREVSVGGRAAVAAGPGARSEQVVTQIVFGDVADAPRVEQKGC